MNVPVARAEVLACMRELEQEPSHVVHVTKLALELFDGLKPLHRLGEPERFLLEVAGYLHDIGHGMKLEDGEEPKSHHKRSAAAIRAREWEHLEGEQVELIALVARYHRKALPKKKHQDYAELIKPERWIVKVLSAMLRIADALDTTHRQLVTALTTELCPGQIVMHLATAGPVAAEVLAARRKGDLATKMFQRELVFVAGEQKIEAQDILHPKPAD